MRPSQCEKLDVLKKASGKPLGDFIALKLGIKE